MVIHNGDLGWTGLGPAEDKPPLVIDSDRMKARAVAAKGFEAVAGGHGKVREPGGPVHLHELAQGDAGDGGKAPVLFLPEKLLGVGVGERLDHGATAAIIDGVRGHVFRRRRPFGGARWGFAGDGSGRQVFHRS